MRAADVIVVGGGNAALCAALTAREAGASVTLLESAPREWRGGNSMHTRNLRCMHAQPEDVLTGSYTEQEYLQDLENVTQGRTNEALARTTIRRSATCRPWMRRHGVHFQHSLTGTLHLSRTNAFFLGGGKALLNAYYRSAERLGVDIRYETQVTDVELKDNRFAAVIAGGRRYQGAACVLASGGFESNREWLREAWGVNEAGEWPADNFLIRGTRFNTGRVLRALLDAGGDSVGDPTQCHAVAVDARAPLYDGGICTRIDCVSLGIVVNRRCQRFYDEGEDFWPKRYAIWGRLVALQPGQIAFSIIDAKAIGRFMPPVFPGACALSLHDLALQLGLDAERLQIEVQRFNAACQPRKFDHSVLDGNATEGITPAKTNWALPLDTPPFYGFALRPGITFTYLGLRVDGEARVHFAGQPSDNLFAAGELMAGNILGQGYLAGIGMTIGTVFGQLAGHHAAQTALTETACSS